MKTVYIEIRGGNLVEAYSDCGITIKVLDWDNIDADQEEKLPEFVPLPLTALPDLDAV